MGLFQEIRLTLSSGGDGAQRRVAWRLALVAVVGAAVLSFNFGLHHLITNDDTRFAVLARDALVNGHWLTPALPDGTPHLMKPPLQAWLIALASWWTLVRSCLVAVLLIGCDGLWLDTYWRSEKYVLLAVDARGQMALYVDQGNGMASGLVDPTVFSIGWDEKYIVVKQHPNNFFGSSLDRSIPTASS